MIFGLEFIGLVRRRLIRAIIFEVQHSRSSTDLSITAHGPTLIRAYTDWAKLGCVNHRYYVKFEFCLYRLSYRRKILRVGKNVGYIEYSLL